MNVLPVFEPYTLNNGVTVDNRLVVAPMTHWASDAQGHLTDVERGFISGRAAGYGMFITAATLVAPEGKAFAGEPSAMSDADLDSLRQTADIIRRQGAKAILQIHHGGKLAVPELLGGRDRIAPSSSEETGEVTNGPVRSMTTDEIRSTIAAYAHAAELAIEAGFDGVEIHGANGYLIQQFFSGHSNRRNDEWGGSLEGRMRFPLAVVDAVIQARERMQRPDFIIGYRLSPEEPEEMGLTMQDTFALTDALTARPLQYLHVSLHNFFAHARRGADTTRLRLQLLHDRINGKLPLIGVGGLLTADDIARAWDTSSAEFIALGRAVLLNPADTQGADSKDDTAGTQTDSLPAAQHPGLPALLRSGDFDRIETVLDPARPDHYRFPDFLWNLNLSGLDFLPAVKK